jgi:NAD(P)-dependent dehydrogenase (short-subunit alcohol dehydrogenase family)
MNKKVAIVTGSTRGIGFEISKSLLENGFNVMICGRKRSSLREAISELSKYGQVNGEVCDVRNEEQVKMLFNECKRLYGRLDLLVNNAGVGYFGKTVENLSGEEFRQQIETNLNGVFYCCHYAIPLMKETGAGRIINISSLAGQNAHPKMAGYNASKFGLNGFTEALMQEVRQDNIFVSLICPGSVNTAFGGDTESESNYWQIQPGDIARVVVDLINLPDNALVSRVEIRPSKPPVK